MKQKRTFLFDHNVISYLYIKDFFGTNEICGCWVFRISTFRILKRLIGFYVCVCWRRLFQSFDDVKNSKYGRMREIPPQQNQNNKICFIFLLSTIPNIFLSFKLFKGFKKIIRIICLNWKYFDYSTLLQYYCSYILKLTVTSEIYESCFVDSIIDSFLWYKEGKSLKLGLP